MDCAFISPTYFILFPGKNNVISANGYTSIASIKATAENRTIIENFPERRSNSNAPRVTPDDSDEQDKVEHDFSPFLSLASQEDSEIVDSYIMVPVTTTNDGTIGSGYTRLSTLLKQ